MDPQINQTPAVAEPQPLASVPIKKSHKKLLLGITIVFVAFVMTLTGYLAYQSYNKPAAKAASQKVKTATTVPVVNPTLEAATSTMTGSALSESSLTSTDDSNVAVDASTAANNVGVGIDENNF